MATLRGLVVLSVAALLLAACGGDTSSTDTTVPTPILEITVTIGVDSSPDRVETVVVGTEVTLIVTAGDTDDEIHVHTIDLESAVTAGETTTFTFVVDTVGEIEVESHITEEVLLVIDVV